EETLTRRLEAFRAFEERGPLGFELLDRAEQIADRIVARDLRAKHGVLALDRREPFPELVIFVDQRFGEFDTALEERANECFPLFREIDRKIACSSHALLVFFGPVTHDEGASPWIFATLSRGSSNVHCGNDCRRFLLTRRSGSAEGPARPHPPRGI